MKYRWAVMFLLVFLLFLVSCNMPSPVGPPPALTNPSPPTPAPTDPPQPPTDTPELEPTTDPYADIVHSEIPPEPVLVFWAYDCDTGRYTTASNQPIIGGGCDQWAINFIERPVNQTMDMYFPHLDIVRFQMGKDENWIFADLMTFRPEGSNSVLNGTYGLELDFDIDSDGDLLVLVTNPADSEPGEWTTVGVQVWEDTNDDVGGETPFLGEDLNPGNGYETQLFDQGLGDDPDLAWARIAPDDPGTIDFAFKRSLVPGGEGTVPILWWTWASQAPLVPGDFDYNDTYDEDEIYQIGNSCRWIFDGPPQPVPNICLYEQPTPEPGDEGNFCWVTYTTGATVIGQCVECPADCDLYNQIPAMSCTQGCP